MTNKNAELSNLLQEPLKQDLLGIAIAAEELLHTLLHHLATSIILLPTFIGELSPNHAPVCEHSHW